MYLRKSGLRKTWLDKCLKRPFSEYPTKVNMINRLKHCCNLNDSTFTVFIDHSESNSAWISVFS